MNHCALRIGRYEVLSELGRGGMGVVYRALDPAIGRMVAVKTVSVHSFAAPEELSHIQQRLVLEIRLAAAISHPHIVSVYDAGQQDGLVYMVMELVEGAALDSWLSTGIALDPVSSCAILRQAASALDHLHAAGIVHRDLKPANILIDSQRAVKITDFGIARAFSDPRLTRTGLLVGTPRHMSPEQFLGRPAGPASDQFSLAIVAWQMLTGKRPFDAEDTASISHRVVNENPASPGPAVLPRTAETVLRRALAKDPAERYASCTGFAEALASALAPRARPFRCALPFVAAASVCIAVTAPLVLGWRDRSSEDLPRPVLVVSETPAKLPSAAAPQRVPAAVTVPAPATLRVLSRPAAATVIFDDGAARCITPCVVSLPRGRHTLSVVSARHRTTRRAFTLPEQSSLFVALEQQSATLFIRTDPPGAAISIDGTARREVTPAMLVLPPGTHAVELAYPAASRRSFDVSLKDGDMKILQFDLGRMAEPPVRDYPPRNATTAHLP